MPLAAVVALVVIVLDQLTKAWAVAALEDAPVDLVGSLRLLLVRNDGAAFSQGRASAGCSASPPSSSQGAVVPPGRLRRDVGAGGGGPRRRRRVLGNLIDRLVREEGWLRGRVRRLHRRAVVAGLQRGGHRGDHRHRAARPAAQASPGPRRSMAEPPLRRACAGARSAGSVSTAFAAFVTGASRARPVAGSRPAAVTVDGEVAAAGVGAPRRGCRPSRSSPSMSKRTCSCPTPTIAPRIVHADEDVVVVDKQAGLVVHPGAGRHSGTLVNAPARQVPRHGRCRRAPPARRGPPAGPVAPRGSWSWPGPPAAHRTLAADLAPRLVTRRFLAPSAARRRRWAGSTHRSGAPPPTAAREWPWSPPAAGPDVCSETVTAFARTGGGRRCCRARSTPAGPTRSESTSRPSACPSSGTGPTAGPTCSAPGARSCTLPSSDVPPPRHRRAAAVHVPDLPPVLVAALGQLDPPAPE